MNLISCALDCRWQQGGQCTLEDTGSAALSAGEKCSFFQQK